LACHLDEGLEFRFLYVSQIRLSFEDFDEALSGFKVSSGYERSKNTDLWVDKYRPRTLEELSVHKKKVALFFLFLLALLSPWFTNSSPFLFLLSLG
jgi:hypothetical protein